MIYRAEIDDAESVADIYIESRKVHVAFAPLAHSDEGIRSWIRHKLIPSGNVQVVEKDGRIVAMMATSEDDDGSWIDQLYVKADLTGQGLGSLLLERAMKDLNRPIFLYTFQQNSGARKIYERHGFRAVKFSDGRMNEEKCPDVLYVLKKKGRTRRVEATSNRPCLTHIAKS